MDTKAVLVFASVVCEFGFSVMKEAKKERQSAMDTPQLDHRLRIQLLGPKDPYRWSTEAKMNEAVLEASRKLYKDQLSSIVNASIEHWNATKDHNSKQARP